MASELTHRGPDASGTWSSGPVGLTHTRLSIIDLAGSAQPMTGASNRSHLVFNGEILNYRQIRSQLAYPFSTDGDSEVLLALYEELGPEGIELARGQFAFAIHDSSTGDTHLFRDRIGIVPLYYYVDDRMFAFASEVKALRAVVGDLEVDHDSLHDYLAHRSVPAPFTLFKGVRKLLPGHRMVVSRTGGVQTSPYWRLPTQSTGWRPSDPEAADLVENALRESIHEALFADVPVGAYLSGGVDSSLIAALVARERNGAELRTFTASFGDARLDETAYARQVATALGTVHSEVRVTAEDFREDWLRLCWHRDAPLSEPADVAMYRLAKLARTQVKVVLTGEGCDEMFGGYPKYRFATATRMAGAVPGSLLRKLDRVLPASLGRLSTATRALSERTEPERMRAWFAPFTTSDRLALLGFPPDRDSLAPYVNGRGTMLNRMLYADMHTWLADNLLERGDRMSMAASLELRPPFLDHRLVELAFTLPDDMKVRGRTTKWLVKEIARKHLSSTIVDRPKVGFKVPLDRWFRGPLRDFAFDSLTDRSSFVGTTFDGNAIRDLLQRHSTGERDEQSRIWTLLSLEMWHRAAGGRRFRV